MNRFTHLIVGDHGHILFVLKYYEIEYIFEDVDVYITENDYHKYKNHLALNGII